MSIYLFWQFWNKALPAYEKGEIIMKKDNLFWGIFFILAAVLLILGQFDLFAGFNLFKILFTILLVCWFVHGLSHRDFGSMLFSIAFLCIMYDDFLGIENLTPWPVLGAAALGSIGLSMIFKKNDNELIKHNGSVYVERPNNQAGSQKEDLHGNNFNINTSFCSAEKHIHSDDFTKAFVKSSCGKTTVYFDDAIIQQGNAQIVLDVNLGEADLFLPKTWNVINQASATFGSVIEKNAACSNGAPTLTITGTVFCGSVNIYYI